ncbi:DM13 domain-containing protein [Intrasporangium sp.]|uniref:DM13 domain-containing protein n=1 Tax=Intrasporangium sp. TaxID=1925024 RepID=UPI00293B33F8|nr:DM13 domain-containing protein [Intrasporangium sp.]MDV3222026.1 DM13 domain-containing protein [Intrasporangium sp.]
MSRRIWFPVVTVGFVLAVVALALFQPWRLFTRTTVDEPLPMAAPAATSVASPEATAPPPPATTGPSPAPTASVSQEPQEPREPHTLAQGAFVDGEHATSGRARLLELEDGSVHLRLEDFSTSDGPDVHVWLTDQPAGGDDWGRFDDGRFVALGILKGTDGNQNYRVPPGTDLDGLTSVVIWCDRFDVAFGSAPLTPA